MARMKKTPAAAAPAAAETPVAAPQETLQPAPAAETPTVAPPAADDSSKPAQRAAALSVTPADFVAEGTTRSKIALAPVRVATQPTVQQQALITLCTRPQGATSAELYTTTTSTKGVPWLDLVANCAKRFGYRMHTTQGADRRTSYHLTSTDPE